MRGIVGWLALVGLAWALGEDRRAVPWRVVAGGLALQVGLAVLLVGAAPARAAVLLLDRAADALQRATDAGSGFVFGYLGGAALPFAELHPGGSVILAFKVLPLVLVISALSKLLFHWGVLQRVTGALAWLLGRTVGVDGPLALAAAAHVFVGNVEAPLLIRPYLRALQRGELFAVMNCGMAGIAGTVMVIYATILRPVIPDALGTILVAAVVSTPAALAVSALMVPFTPAGRAGPHGGAPGDATPGGAAPAGEVPPEGSPPGGTFPGGPMARGGARAAMLRPDTVSSLDALVRGTQEGVAPLVGIATALLVAVALVSLCDSALGLLPGAPTLEGLFALPFRPVLWLMGVPWAETAAAALLMGTKTVLNEFVAYLHLAALPEGTLSARTRVILTYAMCGFANFGSLGIVLGGMGAMVPERRAEMAGLGMRSVLAGTIGTCMSGALAGVLA